MKQQRSTRNFSGSRKGDPSFFVLSSPSGEEGRRLVVSPSISQIVGRDPGVTGIGIFDGSVSRRHLSILWNPQDGSVSLEDLQSTNGTFVNGQQVHECLLNEEDIVRVGDTVMVIRWQDSRDQAALEESAEESNELVGDSRRLRRLRFFLARNARMDGPALVLGAEGTGKEQTVRMMHRLSKRSGPLLFLEASMLDEDTVARLLDAGPVRDESEGMSDDAAGGTVYLQCVERLSQPAQLRLLDLLRSGGEAGGSAVERASRGQRGNRHRLVAGSSESLVHLSREGAFLKDLHALLESTVIHVPSLEERRGDIPLLINRLGYRMGIPRIRLHPDACEALVLSTWQRNLDDLSDWLHLWMERGWQVNRTGSAWVLPDMLRDTGIPMPRCGEHGPAAE